MTKIAVIGAGVAGLLAAHDLHRRGFDVTLYSEKTPEDFLNSVPTGNASRFDMALSYERELGLAHWESEAPVADGIFFTLSLDERTQVFTTLGRMDKPSYAIDVRLQSARWIEDLTARGGKVVFERVSSERLDEIAGEHDLTIVAIGKLGADLFARDDERSVYTEPQRNLALLCVDNVAMRPPWAEQLNPIKVNVFPAWGEAFWVPWYQKDGKQCRSLIFEARPGSPMDRFGDAKTGEQALEIAREVLRDLIPWDYEWLKDMRLADEHSWLVGRFTPVVRRVAGTLPSGRNVIALGDTAMSLDPIGGQGANNGYKMARNLVECIAERPAGPFDPAWMQGTFDRFWERHKYCELWNRVLIDGPPPSGIDFQFACYGSDGHADNGSPQQRLANLWASNWDDPIDLTDDFKDHARSRARIEEVFGTSATWAITRGKLAVARELLRQRAGFRPRHPGPSWPPVEQDVPLTLA